jgi:hypothetical protein
MRNRALQAGVVISLCVFPACRRDLGGEARSTPLSSDQRASSEIIPLDQVKKSQAGVVSQRIANTEVTITYSRPVARGRTLFGGIVPYGEMWNPGADQATAMTVTREVKVGGQPLAAGKYSVWAIPRPDEWTMIFSKAWDVYHTPYPGESQDALRVQARPERGAHMETLTFDFPVVEGKGAVLRLQWGELIVPLSISVP